ncbi:hypothetical protein TNCV_3241261 [Trichonephila clavipes]|nr:hypothetical protein TNCV_3241261 [Trichonephila clavipes]
MASLAASEALLATNADNIMLIITAEIRFSVLEIQTNTENRISAVRKLTDRSVTSRTIAQHNESVTHHSVSARTIRRRLKQSGLFARRPLFGLPLTQNPRRLRR